MPVHEKILHWDIEKPGIATWLFCYYFIFQRYFFTLTAARAMLHWTRREAKNRETTITEHIADISYHYLQKSTICDIIYSV